VLISLAVLLLGAVGLRIALVRAVIPGELDHLKQAQSLHVIHDSGSTTRELILSDPAEVRDVLALLQPTGSAPRYYFAWRDRNDVPWLTIDFIQPDGARLQARIWRKDVLETHGRQIEIEPEFQRRLTQLMHERGTPIHGYPFHDFDNP
jgi:hypothetical protein